MSAEPGQSDERLVSLSRDGDLDAFNRLVERYQTPVYSLCLRLLGNREIAEDASQETFLSAYRALARFAGPSFRAWLMRIAANQCKDQWRRRKRKDVAMSLDEILGTFDSPVEVPDESPGADVVVENVELSEIVQRAMLTLPMDQRQAVALVDLQGLRYEEVAGITGASLGTVKSRVHRGREKLRQVFTARPELLDSYRRLEQVEVSE
ncbi:sigma-70 family RNA polymerase sigma factor [bacterium]|nr:MAG: sigma-70 family RNA polymerase sigma factor [bacterium]MCL4230708.1 sigma-70 family RNA polymerase sigma factor [Dehalococcoidia bacterium]